MQIYSELLELFPYNAHPLYIVSDPDGLLFNKPILGSINQTRFYYHTGDQPCSYDYRVEQIKLFRSSNKIIATDGAHETPIYYSSQQGQKIEYAV